MRRYTLTGIILIVIAGIALSYQFINYAIREKIVDPGLIGVTADTARAFSRQPIVGGMALVGVIVLLVRGNKKG